jgi:hypothetical protein
MTDSRRVVKVFLASPGDLSEERRASKAAVDECNALFANEFGCQIELVGWEDTVSVYGRPQATINRELERCELFLGLIWKRWGTPPSIGGSYTSGFEEEFETSVQRRTIGGRPEISLFFKDIDSDLLRDPGDDLKKVLAFKNKLISDKTILFETFVDAKELEKKIRRCITQYVLGLRNREAEEVSAQNQAPKSDDEKPQVSEETNPNWETPLSVEGAKFLRSFISSTERVSSREEIPAVDIARARLLANIVGRNGNDETALGVHDANLLFTKGAHFTFGFAELNGLLASGFENYVHQNGPLWKWFKAVDGFTRNVLPLYSIFDSSTDRKLGALAAMTLISEPLARENPDHRDILLSSWFAKDSPSSVKVAALRYLGDMGIPSDLPAITQELDKSDSQTLSAAADAVIRINLRDGREKAILALYELQPSSLSPKLLMELFNHDETLTNEVLLQGVGHRDPGVRRKTVELLFEREALSIELADKLLIDGDAEVRYVGLKQLIKSGRAFSNEEANKILVKQSQGKGFGLIGSASRDSEGKSCWDDFQLHQLRSLPDKDLEAAVLADNVLIPDPYFILTERQFSRRADELRRSIDDRYKAKFAQSFQKMVVQFGWGADFQEKMKSIEDSVRKGLTRKALNIICNKGDLSDLRRIRLALEDGFVEYSENDFEYLRKFGEWRDISLIVSCVARPIPGRSLLLSTLGETTYKAAARAIYALGRTRLSEVLGMTLPGRLLAHLIVEMSDTAFQKIGDTSINMLLRSDEDMVRKVVALKCVQVLSKAKVVKLMDAYISSTQQHFYNVIHWLDFGASAPRDRASAAAKRLLNKEWREA